MDGDVMCVCVVCVMEYYSAIKKEMMPFEAAWMDLEIIKPSDVSQRQIFDITYMWNLKNDTN